jgi:hypothetical protein
MSKVVTSQVVRVEYDEQGKSLRLLDPLEGVADHEELSVVVNHVKPKRPWSYLEGVLKGEDGESFAQAVAEAFPIEPIKK